MNTESCAHQWKRWPVVDFDLRYTCAICEEPESVYWATTANAGKSLDDLDRVVIEKRGGTFAGEMIPQGGTARLGEPTVSGPDPLSDWCRFRFPLQLPVGWIAREAEIAPNGDLIIAASPVPPGAS